jgi:hypothetical protein
MNRMELVRRSREYDRPNTWDPYSDKFMNMKLVHSQVV